MPPGELAKFFVDVNHWSNSAQSNSALPKKVLNYLRISSMVTELDVAYLRFVKRGEEHRIFSQ